MSLPHPFCPFCCVRMYEVESEHENLSVFICYKCGFDIDDYSLADLKRYELCKDFFQYYERNKIDLKSLPPPKNHATHSATPDENTRRGNTTETFNITAL